MTARLLSASELAAEQLPGLPATRAKIRARAERDGWPFVEERRQGGVVRLYEVTSLPVEAQRALEARKAEASLSSVRPVPTVEDLDAIAERHREIAIERVRVVARVLDLVAQGRARMQATAQAAGEWRLDDEPPSSRTVRRWVSTCEGHGRGSWFALLVPQWKSSSTKTDCHPEAWAYFCDDYARASRPCYRACYRRTVKVAADKGWSPVPCYATLVRRHRVEVPRAELLLAREGTEALVRRFPAQERDRSGMFAMEAWNADGHKWDVFVRWPDGSTSRPLAVVVQDLATGKILSWRVDQSESADLVRLAFAEAFSRYGVPHHLYLDNGRAFASKYLTGRMTHRFRFQIKEEEPQGIFVALGIDVHWVTPYHGQAKPIERAFRDLCENVAKHPSFAGAYTGNSPTTKPHDYNDKNAVPVEQFLRVLAAQIDEHNARVGRRSKALAGRSFDQAFAESYATQEVRKLTESQKRLTLLAADALTVRRGTADIYLAKNRYWTEELVGLEGQRVVVRFDPDHLDAGVYVYRLDGKYVGFAQAQGVVAFRDVAAARAHLRARRQYLKAVRDAAAGRRHFDTEELGEAHLAAQGAQPLAPKADVIRPFFGKPALKSAPAVPMAPTSEERARREEADDLIAVASSNARGRLRRIGE